MENVSTEARRDLRVGEQLDQFDLLEQTQCSRVLFIGIFEERSVEAIKPQVALRVVLPVALDAEAVDQLGHRIVRGDGRAGDNENAEQGNY